MQGPAHLGISWLLGVSGGARDRRDRRIVGLAGLVPDIDVIVYPLAYVFFLGDLDRAFGIYTNVHHRYTHGIVFAVLVAFAAYRLASGSNRRRIAALAFAAVGIHIACDVIASGNAWPVYPLWPVSNLAWSVEWSWSASDWRNVGISVLAIVMTLVYAKRKGYSPVECFSYRADDWLAAVMRGEVTSTRRFRIVLYSVLAVVTAAVVLPLWLYLE